MEIGSRVQAPSRKMFLRKIWITDLKLAALHSGVLYCHSELFKSRKHRGKYKLVSKLIRSESSATSRLDVCTENIPVCIWPLVMNITAVYR
jgi:hypothetical protein